MNRPFLFLAAEFAVTQGLVFQREAWQHTMTGRRLVLEPDGRLHRDLIPGESLRGILYYASVDDEALRRSNLKLLADNGIPCWPDPAKLLALDDRHTVMRECMAAGLTTDDVHVLSEPAILMDLERSGVIERPYVLKTGNLHQGHGKHLIGSDSQTPQWEGTATVEPFYEGTSCRVFCLSSDDDGSGLVLMWGIRYDNPTSWIKNSAGADLEVWEDMPPECFEHAARVHRHFGLDISGIDYVVEDDGTVHFLEYNQFPGLAPCDEIAEKAGEFLARRMTEVEQWAERR